MPVTLDQLIPPFLEYLQFEKRYSAHTVKSYRADLGQLDVYLKAQYGSRDIPPEERPSLEITEIVTPLLRSWLADLKLQGIEPRSINRKISALKSFFRFHKRNNTIHANPTTVLKVLKTGKRLPSFLKEEQTRELVVEPETGDWKERTAGMILDILYQTGLRVSELVDLREKHIDEHLCQIKVLGKGNKERIIPLSRELLAKMKGYKDAKRAEFESPDLEYFLVSTTGKKLYVKYVYREVNDKLKQFRQVSKKSPHVMRHSFATQLVNNGADLNAIKELLGHSSLAATQVYTHNTIEQLKDVHKKAHPKA